MSFSEMPQRGGFPYATAEKKRKTWIRIQWCLLGVSFLLVGGSLYSEQIGVLRYKRVQPMAVADQTVAANQTTKLETTGRRPNPFDQRGDQRVDHHGVDDGVRQLWNLAWFGLTPSANSARLIELNTSPSPIAGTNRTFTLSVMCTASTTLWLTMWLAISGAGKHGLLPRFLGHLERRGLRN